MKKRIVVAAALGFLATAAMQAQAAPFSFGPAADGVTSCKANPGLVLASTGGSFLQSMSLTDAYCEDLTGTSCSPNGSRRTCTIRSDNTQGQCHCFGGSWECTY